MQSDPEPWAAGQTGTFPVKTAHPIPQVKSQFTGLDNIIHDHMQGIAPGVFQHDIPIIPGKHIPLYAGMKVLTEYKALFFRHF
jgi:hypothetical protein